MGNQISVLSFLIGGFFLLRKKKKGFSHILRELSAKSYKNENDETKNFHSKQAHTTKAIEMLLICNARLN